MPTAKLPSVVTERVSGETSTEKSRSLRETTVRQIPFTLTLSPILRSLITVEAKIVSLAPDSDLFMTVIPPISSTIPVNISLSS